LCWRVTPRLTAGSFTRQVDRRFCRPSCPSRRPKRENVEFFDSPTQAQQAGYRACRRCTPLERNPQTQKVEAACRYIDENLDITLSLTAISRHVAISPFHFNGCSNAFWESARGSISRRGGQESFARRFWAKAA